MAPCAWFISLFGGSAQPAERMVMMSARRRATRSICEKYTAPPRAAPAGSGPSRAQPRSGGRRITAPQHASISYHEGSGAMAMVPVVDRPREKLLRVGAEALGDTELIALLLG